MGSLEEKDKFYIADTNVLINNPDILSKYNTVLLSHINREIEKLELTRKNDNILQYKIRKFKRSFDKDIHMFIDIKDYEFKLDEQLDGKYVDNIILQAALDNGYGIITNDKLLEMKCLEYNIECINPKATTYIEYKGFKEEFITEKELEDIYLNLNKNVYSLLTNEYIVFYDDLITDKLEILDIFKWDGESLVSLPKNKNGELSLSFKSNQFGDFSPRDAHQMMAVDSIFNNQVTQIRGRAGSGKSMISLEAAWHLIEREGRSDGFERLVVFVNPTPTRNSQELGFYKGDKLEKLLQSSVGVMLKSKFGDEHEIQKHITNGRLDILPFVDLRGYETGERKTIIWILESQNLTSDLMKLGLQRVSENAKVIIDGDYHAQVDKDAYATDNGMKRASEVFRGEDIYGEIELQNIYRSRIADLADKM